VSSDNEPSEPHAESRPWLDRLSRSGHLEYDRILFFSDAIFAIAITLLVLEIRVPGYHDNPGGEIRAAVPNMISFGISFVVIGLFWIGHHSLSRYIAAFDRWLISINLLFLGTIAFMPFPTELLNSGSHGASRAATVFYALSVAAAGLAELAIWLYASYGRHLLVPGVSPAMRRYLSLRLVPTPAVFLLSIPVAYFSPNLATYFWLLILVVANFLNRYARPAEQAS
jgi:TMEM175 potassium channel family protein